MDKHVHIVTLDVPWPVDYGGVVDLFYKLKALHQQGIKIHLHCFTQGRTAQKEINKYCESVQYYPRKKSIAGFSLKTPFIVTSRKNSELIANLKKDNYPVLLEGIHCTYYLQNGELHNRKVIVRLHNIEFEYYKQLANNERNFLKKIYFLHESKLLYNYEKSIANKAAFIAVGENDTQVYQQLFAAKNIQHIPVFLPYTSAMSKEGKGSYCLYQGNLSINENENAASWLIEKVFSHLSIPFIIAGKNPSQKLQRLVNKYPHCSLVSNPPEATLQDLITNAQVNVLPSFNTTGVKLKLLNALFNGRHCVVNKEGVEGAKVENCCHIADDAVSFQKIIQQVYEQPFTQQETAQRNKLLEQLYNNEVNAKKIIDLLY